MLSAVLLLTLCQETNWKAGKRDGTHKTFFEKTGKPLTDEQFADGVRTARKEWDERREVDIAKRRMAPAGEVIELIGVETEGAVGGDMEGDDGDSSPSIEKPS